MISRLRGASARTCLSLLVALSFGCGDDSSPGPQADGGQPIPRPRADSGTTPVVDAGTTGSSDASTAPTTCGDTPLTDWEQMMLDEHNRWRTEVQPPAANMHRVYWDRNIAANAAAWVASCDPDWPHSDEADRSNVGGYEVLGENLSYCAGTGCSPLPTVNDGSGQGDGGGWWDERHDYTWEDDSSTGITSHYTQMVSSNIYAIGCATQRCNAPGPFGWNDEWWWTICQYGPRGQGYWVGTKPYERGEGGLVEPPAEVFEQHPGLCR